MKLTRRNFIKGGLASSVALVGRKTLAQLEQPMMLRKTIPSSGEQLPVIGFGTNKYGTGTDPSIRAGLVETLKVFNDNGGTLIDSSSHYKGSEDVLGGLLAELELTEEMFVATKCGAYDDLPLETKMQNSLIQLGVEKLDLYQVHNAATQDWQSILPVLQEWKQAGKIRYIGITGSDNEDHPVLAEIMRSQVIDFVQLNYNLIDRNAEQVLLPIARESGIAVVGNVPFGQGSLFDAVSGLELPAFAKEFCQSWGNFFLKYNISHPDVIATIPGTTKPHHALDNVQAGMGRLPSSSERKMQEDFIASL